MIWRGGLEGPPYSGWQAAVLVQLKRRKDGSVRVKRMSYEIICEEEGVIHK